MSEMRLSATSLQDFANKIFIAAGADSAEAMLVVDSLVTSSLRGHDSHGILRIAEYAGDLIAKKINSPAALNVVKENAVSIHAQGNYGFGQILVRQLLELLAPKAKTNGIAIASLSQSWHIGRLGEWAELGASFGLITLVMANDNGLCNLVAPPGGLKQILSTNPFAIGLPKKSGAAPFVLDISTTNVAAGKVRLAYAEGRQMPRGCLLDHLGEPTTDPRVRMEEPFGSILPLGGLDFGYKGFGLSMMLDIVISGLSGGFCPPSVPDVKYSNNVLAFMINPDFFAGQDHLQQELERLVSCVRASPLKDGVEKIILPGDRSSECFRDRSVNGVPLGPGLQKILNDLALKLGVGGLVGVVADSF